MKPTVALLLDGVVVPVVGRVLGGLGHVYAFNLDRTSLFFGYDKSEDGVWRTIHGRRVLIREGESATQAIERSLLRDKEGRPNVSEEEQLKWASSLSKKEGVAVRAWTKGDFRDIQAAYLNGDTEGDPLAKAFESAINKAPVVNGTVYRGLSVEFSGKVGSAVEFKAPISATKLKSVADEFNYVAGGPGGTKQNTLFEIKTRSGRDISAAAMARYQKQEEIILPKGKYKVVAIKKATRIEKTKYNVEYKVTTSIVNLQEV